MRITKYTTKLNEDKLNILVKEKSFNYENKPLTSPEHVYKTMNDLFDMNNLAEEYVYMIGFDNKNKVLGIFEISHGTVNSSVMSPREILIRALLCGATNLILVHNHPSGNVEPSKTDIGTTKRVKDACNVVGIGLQDHIVMGSEGYCSFRQNGLLD